MLLTFILNLICATNSCQYYFEYPSDSLGNQNQNVTSNNYLKSGKRVEYPQITTNYGIVEGYTMYTIKRRPIYAFEGIPFGEDTGGANRFKPAIPKRPWSHILDAKAPGSCCMQFIPTSARAHGSENCLFLNVYTPIIISQKRLTVSNQPKKLLPVFVYIHGGALFFSEGAHYGPAYLLDENVLLLTINYRLGIFGFLSTGDHVLPGNLGFKDQALALKWIYENVKYFGGDPSLITIIGLSSGGISVHMQVISSLARKYFSGAVSLSGTAFNAGTIMTKTKVDTLNRKLAHLTKCPYPSSELFVNCLRSKNAYRLAPKLVQLYERSFARIIQLGAVIEDSQTENAFLTKSPDELYKNGDISRVPWIATRTIDEGLGPVQILRAFRQQFRLKDGVKKFGPIILQYNHMNKTSAEIKEIGRKINNFYFGQSSTSIDDHDKRDYYDRLGDITTDRDFGFGLHKSLQAHSTIAPTYSYLYGFKGRNSIAGLVGTLHEEDAIVHADDLNTMFNMSRHFPGYKTNQPEYAVVKLLCNLLANFGSKRVPLYTDENGTDHNIWEPVTDPRNIRMLQIDHQVKMVPEPDKKRIQFWESLGLDDFLPWKIQ